MVELDSGDLFQLVRYAQKYGLLELLPPMQGSAAPGEKFFESFQSFLLDNADLEKLDAALFHLAPTIRFMSEEMHWQPADFTAEQMFSCVRNLQKLGAFDVFRLKQAIPADGDRFFEYVQVILTEKIGAEAFDRALYQLGQCIAFLASNKALENLDS